MLKPGDTLEHAIWLSGEETPAMIEQWGKDVPTMLLAPYPRLRIELGPFRHSILYPGEDRVPRVPEHIKGPNVRLLVSEADVVSVSVITPGGGFVSDLSKVDLRRLRTLTRKAVPHGNRLTDEEVDMIIEKIGPQSAMRTVKAAKNLGTVH